jgi:hypothetical protein
MISLLQLSPKAGKNRIMVHDETYEHLTPLTAIQECILELIGLSMEIFSKLVPQLSKTDFYSHEP